MENTPIEPEQLTLRRIFHTWWPLAASWLMMGFELPAVSAVIARLQDPEINLAAYGGVAFALALLIEAPVIMMLAASTALSKNLTAYHKLWRFMMVLGGTLTGLHILIVFTPMYSFVVEKLIGAPQAIVEPARIGLMILLPWTWFIAYRRFNQGVLIRYGHSNAVGIGTLLRVTIDFTILIAGLLIKTVPGIIIGPTAVIAGVIGEGIYSGWRVRPVVRDEIPPLAADAKPLTLAGILNFYIPLAMTSLIFLLIQPIGSAAISRMPGAIASLAVWPVMSGLVFLFRSAGIAYLEVVVALLDQPLSSVGLWRFTRILAVCVFAGMLVMSLTGLSEIWFGRLSGLGQPLVDLARFALILAILWPVTNVFQSWFQGVILQSGRTRAVPEAVVLFLVFATVIDFVGVFWGGAPGVYINTVAVLVGSMVQTLWLWYRSRKQIRIVFERDGVPRGRAFEGKNRDLSRAVDPEL